MSTSSWLWPTISTGLAILFLWALQRKPRAIKRMQHARIVEMEDALKEICKLEQESSVVNAETLARAMDISVSMAGGGIETLLASDWVEEDAGDGVRLTMQGRERAQELIRIHRLWERYLVDREGMPLEAVHSEAHRREHETALGEAAKLDAELDHPAWDPHGDIIPDAGRPVPPPPGRALSICAPGRRLRILRVKNEPAVLLAQLVALGLVPGTDVEIEECVRGSLRVRTGGAVFPLAMAAAECIHVVPAPISPVPLGKIPVGTRAMVVEVTGEGKQQRRMLDMGLVPGAEVTAVRAASLGDPVEYRIKGTAIAMRRSDASKVLVEEMDDE